MSNSINEEEGKGKNEPLVNDGGEVSKQKLLLYYGLTVGAVLLIVIIVFIIAVKVGGSPKEDNKKNKENNANLFVSKYISEVNDTMIKLFNPKYKDSISSMKIDGKEVSVTPEYSFSKGEHTVEVFLKNELDSMEKLFENCKNLKEIDLSQVNTKNVTTMAEMFIDCTQLTSVDLSKLDTSKVINMKSMFNGCFNLESINLNNIDTSKVEYMNFMFYECVNLKNLELNNFKTSNVKNMTGMFFDCNSLEKLNLSSFNTANVLSMKMMFDSCGSLQNLNVNNFDTSKVTDMSYMFASLTVLTSLDLGNFRTKEVKKMNNMFSEDIALKEINLKSFDTSNLEDMGLMFYNCKSITSLNFSNFNTDKVKNMRDLFSKCKKLNDLDIKTFNTKNLEEKDALFFGVSKDGVIYYNSKLFNEELFKGTNIENWDKQDGKFKNMTTMEITKDMGIGINLGNTLEAFGDWIWEWGDHTIRSYETAWGSPEINKEMIEGIKNEGFGVMRLPVHWFNMMSEDYTINKDLLERVKQVVEWAISIQLYVILNIHHDERDLFKNMTVTPEQNLKYYKYIWEQIAENFKDYNYYLMFESLNEEACWGDVYNEWSGTDEGKKTVLDLTHDINQVFVDVVRSSGGNNKDRHLLLAGYCTSAQYTCDPMYKLPTDPVNRFAVSVHYYTPSTFCIISEDADWGKAQSTWGTKDDIKLLNDNFDFIKDNLIDKGIPVIVGEYGSTTKNKDIDSVRNFIYSICKAAYDRDILPVLWDTPGGWYNRVNSTMNDTILGEMLMSVKN